MISAVRIKRFKEFVRECFTIGQFFGECFDVSKFVCKRINISEQLSKCFCINEQFGVSQLLSERIVQRLDFSLSKRICIYQCICFGVSFGFKECICVSISIRFGLTLRPVLKNAGLWFILVQCHDKRLCVTYLI